MNIFLNIEGVKIGSSKNPRHLNDIVLTSYSAQPLRTGLSGGSGTASTRSVAPQDVFLTMGLKDERKAVFKLMELVHNGGRLHEARISQEFLRPDGKVKRTFAITMTRTIVTSFMIVRDSLEANLNCEKMRWSYT